MKFMKFSENSPTASLVVLGLLLLTVGQACQSSRAPSYRFEPEARAVWSDVGVPLSRDPKLALDASGGLYLLGVLGEHAESSLGLAVSHNGGDSFAPPVLISKKGAWVRSYGENSPELVLTPQEVFAVWEEASPAKGVELLVARSGSFGHHFEGPVHVLDKMERSVSGWPSLGVAPNRDVYAVWLDGRDAPETPDTFSVYLARSTDGGATFGANMRVAGDACPCCRPTLAFGSKGQLHVFWRKVFPGDIRDIVVSTSTDGGQSFSPPVRVAIDNWKIRGCPDSGPTAALAGGRLYVAWMSEATGKPAGIRVSWSDDGGNTFASPVVASADVVDANRPAFSVSDDGRVLLVFQGRDPMKREGWSPVGVYLVEIDARGRISRPMPVPGNRDSVSHPSVVAGRAGRVFIAWTESGEEGMRIRLVRGRKLE